MNGKSTDKQLPVLSMDEELDIDEYEIVGAEFFAQIREPAFTVNGNNDKGG